MPVLTLTCFQIDVCWFFTGSDAAENWVIEIINEWLTPPQEPTE
jgi:hypothetical protein